MVYPSSQSRMGQPALQLGSRNLGRTFDANVTYLQGGVLAKTISAPQSLFGGIRDSFVRLIDVGELDEYVLGSSRWNAI